MPLAYSPTAQSTNSNADIPDGFAGSVAQWKKVLDTRALVYSAGAGVLATSGNLSVDTGGTNAVFAVNLPTITAINLFDGSSNLIVKAGGGTAIGQTKVEGGGNLVADTWYYVYAYLNGSSLDYQISVTAPGAGLIFKSGGVLYRYLGCFRTITAGAPIAMRMTNGRYLYRVSGQAVADLRVKNAGVDVANTAVACSALVPPTSRIATVRVEITNAAAQFNYGYVRTNGDAGAGEIVTPLPNINLATAASVFDVETDSSQNIAYRTTNTAAAGAAPMTIYINGFAE